MSTYTVHAIARNARGGQVFDPVLLGNPEGDAQNLSTWLVQSRLWRTWDGAVVSLPLHDALHHFLNQVHTLANFDSRKAVNFSSREA
ncbi:hypothetical protein D3C80_1431520 [compost metagenome]